MATLAEAPQRWPGNKAHICQSQQPRWLPVITRESDKGENRAPAEGPVTREGSKVFLLNFKSSGFTTYSAGRSKKMMGDPLHRSVIPSRAFLVDEENILREVTLTIQLHSVWVNDRKHTETMLSTEQGKSK